MKFLNLASSGQVDEAYRLVKPGGKHHNPYYAAGWDALAAGMREAAGRAPEQVISVKRVISDGELVAVHSHVVPDPGGAGIAVVHMFRFEEGQIAELWDVGQLLPVDSPNGDGVF